MMQAWTTKQALLWAVTAGLVLAGSGLMGCTDANPLYQPGPLSPEDCRLGEEYRESFEVFERPEKIDLWFVVADTAAMADHQQAFSDSLPPMLDRLADEGYDVRAAVSTMDGTVEPGLAPRITDADGCSNNGRQVADSDRGDWIDTIQCNLLQGTDGDRRIRPLDVTYDALVGDPSSLEGLRRETARLVIVMLANEDDCSGTGFNDDPNRPARDLCAWQSDQMRSVASWVDDMRSTAVVSEGISLAVISGPPATVEYQDGESVRHVCNSTLGSGYPSPRLYEAARRFGDQGLFLSSCVFDFEDHFDEISRRLIRRDRVTLCASYPMAQEPLDVEAVYTGSDSEFLDFGTDYAFLGVTDRCENGALQLRGRAIDDAHRVRVTYCRF